MGKDFEIFLMSKSERYYKVEQNRKEGARLKGTTTNPEYFIRKMKTS